MKNRVLQTYPLRMNLAPEIRSDWKRYLEILSSADLLCPKWLRLWYGHSTTLCTSCNDYSGWLSLKCPNFSPGILDMEDLCQLLILPKASVLPKLANTSLVVKHGKHHAHPLTEVVAWADRLLPLFVLEYWMVLYILVQAFPRILKRRSRLMGDIFRYTKSSTLKLNFLLLWFA
jgi:hypothetical protein